MSADAPALELVRDGWRHVQAQRPLAAWASWQQALRIDPDNQAASQALGLLAEAVDLPAAARAIYRFRPPRDEARRVAWNAALAGRDLDDLGDATAAFAAIGEADPGDSAAWYNRALGLAWLGRNGEAVGALSRVVALDAADRYDDAAEAWALAEILRHGGGAEPLADDLDYQFTIGWSPVDDGDPLDWLATVAPNLVRVVVEGADDSLPRVAEWLDRPWPSPDGNLAPADLPRLVAVVVATPGSLRFSGPDRPRIEAAEATVAAVLADSGRAVRPAERRSTPLPLRLLDAALGTFRLPQGLDDDDRHGLVRGLVEHYYEFEWMAAARLNGLAGSWAAALEAVAAGDPVARARMEGIVRLREQLARRPRGAALTAGYPFDRLRRRLGLAPINPDAVDPDDPACMGLADLRRLDPSSLSPASRRVAAASALALHDPALAARLAIETTDR